MYKKCICVISVVILLTVVLWIYIRRNNEQFSNYDIKEIPNALTKEECQQLISYYKDKLVRSTVFGDTGNDVTDDRTSHQAWIYKHEEVFPEIMSKLYNLASELSGIEDVNMFEDIQIASYKESQQYKPHFDACVSPKYCKSNDKIYRKATLLVYLNDSFQGGETHFPQINKKVKPETGKAVYFVNTDEDGNEIDESLHAGLPIESGEKWIANVWIKFDPKNNIIQR